MEHLVFVLLNPEEAFHVRWDGSPSQPLVVVAMRTIHPAFLRWLIENVLQTSVPHYVYPIDRFQLWEKIWDEYLLGIILEYSTASWLQHVINGSTIQDLGTNIGCIMHRWSILFYAVQHARFSSMSKVTQCQIWMEVMAGFHAQRRYH